MRMSADGLPEQRSARTRAQAWGRAVFQALVAVFGFVVGLHWITRQDLADFLAFWGSGGRVLAGQSPYGFYPTLNGGSVFQSAPWLAWLFAPLALLPVGRAWQIFYLLNLLLVALILYLAFKEFRLRLDPLTAALVLACGLALSYPCLSFGQVSILQVAILALMSLALQRGRPVLAGALLPLALLKPHLLLWFIPYALIAGGRRFRLASLASTLLFALAALALQPSWPGQMLQTIFAGQAGTRMETWKYTTLSGLFSLDPKLGLLIPIVFLPGLFWLSRRIKSFPLDTRLAIVLAFSLAASPYSFSYDLPLLLPALAWLTFQWPARATLLWTAMAVLIYLFGFQNLAYLITLLVCGLILFTLHRQAPPAGLAVTPAEHNVAGSKS